MLGGITCSASGNLLTGWQFGTLTGEQELSLWERCVATDDRLVLINDIIDTYCKFEAQGGSAKDLCIADRDYILSLLACHFGQGLYWAVSTCPHCDERSDIQIDLSKLPFKPAGETYPFAEIVVDGTSMKLKVPSLADQKMAIKDIKNIDDAIHRLAGLCAEELPKTLSPELIEKINDAVQSVSPEVARSLQVECNSCGETTTADLQILPRIIKVINNPLDDVHEIAAFYHWSEQEILKLTATRRQSYIRRILADQGRAYE